MVRESKTQERNRKPVVSSKQPQRKPTRVDTLADFFAAAPLRNSRLRMERRKQAPRPIKL
jgi:hypothetical protein